MPDQRRDGELGTHQRQPGHPIVVGQSDPCRHLRHIRGRMQVIGIPKRHAKFRGERDEDFAEREQDRRVLPIVSRQTSRAIPSAPRKELLSADVLALRTVLFERNAAGRNHGRGTGN